MTTLQLATFSNNAIMFAAIVYSLALLSHITEWAVGHRLTRTPLPVAHPAGSSEGTGTEWPRDEQALRVETFARIGVAMTILGFVLSLAGFVTRGMAAERVPWGNMYEFAIAACVGAVGIYLLLLPVSHIRWLGLPVTALVVTVLMLAVLLLDVPAGPLVPALDSYWLWIHVSAAFIATGAFTLGAVASTTYLVRSRLERRGGSGAASVRERLPDLEQMDEFSYRVHAFGFAVWTFAALIAGPIWARYAWGRYWGWDPKEVWAFITWVAYAAYLHARTTGGWRGSRAAAVALAGFATLVFNFVGINLFGSGLHTYSGM